MATIMPQSELLRRAVSYVNDTQKEEPSKKITDIVDDAAMRFNLSPLDSDALLRLFTCATSSSGNGSNK